MKIALIHTLYLPRSVGGAERVVQLLAGELSARGHETVIIAAAPRGEAVDHEVDGIRVREVPLVNVRWPYDADERSSIGKAVFHGIDISNPVMGRRVGRILEDESPGVVHTHGLSAFSPRVWSEAKRRRLPVVHTLHDHRLICLHAAMFKHDRACVTRCASCRLASFFKSQQTSNVDVVVGVTGFVLDQHLSAGCFEGALTDVVPVPIPSNAFAERLPLSSGHVRFGYLGRLQPGKGIELLIQATNDLGPRGWSLQIAGTGDDPYVARLASLRRHSNVSFVGRVVASDFLAGIDVLIAPSQLYESAGLVAVEAFAAGVPVVASRRGGLAELVRPEGGWLFDPERPSELSSVLQALIERPDEIVARRDRCAALAMPHRIELVAEHYLELYAQARARTHGA